MYPTESKKATAVFRNCNIRISIHITQTFMYLLYVYVFIIWLVGLNMTIIGGKILPKYDTLKSIIQFC
jgi:hypothetical protein